jgi:Zn-dependent peptidase ImmA (M78 family)
MRFNEFKNTQPDLIGAIRDFLPIAMKELEIDQLPKIKFEKIIVDDEQPAFGRFIPDSKVIHLGVANRHPIDILRTLAHELVHYKQTISGNMPDDAGKTGSPQENEAHIVAGIIMRNFNKTYPNYFKDSALEIDV